MESSTILFSICVYVRFHMHKHVFSTYLCLSLWGLVHSAAAFFTRFTRVTKHFQHQTCSCHPSSHQNNSKQGTFYFLYYSIVLYLPLALGWYFVFHYPLCVAGCHNDAVLLRTAMKLQTYRNNGILKECCSCFSVCGCYSDFKKRRKAAR